MPGPAAQASISGGNGSGDPAQKVEEMKRTLTELTSAELLEELRRVRKAYSGAKRLSSESTLNALATELGKLEEEFAHRGLYSLTED